MGSTGGGRGAVWGLTLAFLFVLGMLAFVVVIATAFGVATSGRGLVLGPAVDLGGSRRWPWPGGAGGGGRALSRRLDLGRNPGVAGRAGKHRPREGAAPRHLGGEPTIGGADPSGTVPAGYRPARLAWVLLWAASRESYSPEAALLWTASLAAGLAVAGLWLP